ncbi:hypothetical protein BDB00DRAFT_869133 [Zychaea mexicana]|uniref:uncharacterized protein n=1 Tax=Zychaea mexicana TaxID=64656 RepID=UPI0022FEFD8E|nr:uncharacterized protein BDB00DRAFT_869133 [Zychaea mexicana]KAI9496904.1 hypothetical protein BDB00DRAFT_869133 [Zychaea mexicana]
MAILEKLSEKVGQSVNVGSRHTSDACSSRPASVSTIDFDDSKGCEDATLSLPLDMKVPSIHDRYEIGEYDVSLVFCAFQVVSQNNYNTLHIGTSISSILLIQRNRFYERLVGVGGPSHFHTIRALLFPNSTSLAIHAKPPPTAYYRNANDVGFVVLLDKWNKIFDDTQEEYLVGAHGMNFDQAPRVVLLIQTSTTWLKNPVDLEVSLKKIIKNIKLNKMARTDAIID